MELNARAPVTQIFLFIYKKSWIRVINSFKNSFEEAYFHLWWFPEWWIWIEEPTLHKPYSILVCFWHCFINSRSKRWYISWITCWRWILIECITVYNSIIIKDITFWYYNWIKIIEALPVIDICHIAIFYKKKEKLKWRLLGYGNWKTWITFDLFFYERLSNLYK